MYGHPIDLVPDFKVLYWGPQVVWGFITILYLCHALLLYLRLCEVLHTVLFRIGTRFRGADSPRLGICCRAQSYTQTLSPSRRPADSVAGVDSVGWPPCTCF